VQVHRVTPGRRVPARLTGAVLARDLVIGGDRWSKGRRLTAADLVALGHADPGEPVSVLLPDPGELHEDDAAIRLAAAVAGPGVTVRGPAESRVDLLAEADGVLNVRVADLERLNRIDPLEVFTAFDGQVVARGELVASVKVAPHLVEAATVDAGARLAGFGSHPLVWVAPFLPRRVGVIVKESVRGIARERFEASVRAKVLGLGSEIVAIDYVEDDDDAVETAMAALVRRPDPVDLILTAGAASTDPLDACFVAIAALGGRVVRRGVPAHPGSMLWLARIGGTAILGLPTCGAYSKATAADLLLPRLLSGDPPNERTVARLGHGGILTRSQRFRFPAYARELDAPDG
jgi:molybdenum cofactor cytidylyltransferase